MSAGGAPARDDRTDWRAVRALAVAWLRRDVRLGGGRLGFLAGLVPILGGAFWTSSLVASMLVAAGCPVRLFASAGFLTAGLVVGVLVAGPVGAASIDPRDVELLGPRPIGPRTYTVARITSSTVYTLFLSVPAHLPFALLGVLAPGSHSGFIAAYGAVAVPLAVAGTTVVVLGFVTLARLLGVRRLYGALTLVQVLLTVGLWPLVPLVTRVGTPGPLFALQDAAWTAALPPAWAGSLVAVLLGATETWTWTLAAAAPVAVIGCVGVLPRLLSLDYARTVARQLAAGGGSAAPPRPSRWDPAIRAGFDLARSAIRDPRLTARLVPGLVMPFLYGAAILAVFGRIDPFAGGSLLAVTPAAMLAMLPPGFLVALQRSDRWRAAYVFEAAPLEHPARIVLGAELAAGLLYLVPAGALVAWAAIQWPWAHAAVLALDLGAAFGVALVCAPLFVDRLPFCRPAEAQGGARDQLASVLGMALPMGSGFAVHAATRGSLAVHAAVDVAVLAAGVLLHAALIGGLDRRLRRNFGRGHAVRIETERRTGSKVVAVVLGILALAAGALFITLPAGMALWKAGEDGDAVDLAALRRANVRMAVVAALRAGDVATAGRLAPLAGETPAAAVALLMAEVAFRQIGAPWAVTGGDAITRVGPREPESRLLAARMMMLAGDCEGASTALAELSSTRGPAAVRAYHDLAVAAGWCGDAAKAALLLDRFLEVYPDDPTARRNRRRLAAGDAKLELAAPLDVPWRRWR